MAAAGQEGGAPLTEGTWIAINAGYAPPICDLYLPGDYSLAKTLAAAVFVSG
jgi:hypothetical protein